MNGELIWFCYNNRTVYKYIANAIGFFSMNIVFHLLKRNINENRQTLVVNSKELIVS